MILPPRLANRDPQNDSGYTLVELLISLAILALLLAMVPGTLRLGKRAWETPGQIDETPGAAALAFAAGTLESALPIFSTDASGLQKLAFAGSKQSLSFVAELASGPYGGGLYLVDIGPPETANARIPGLAVRLALYRAEGDTTGLPIEERELGSGYSALAFRYFGSPAGGEAAQWLDRWPRDDRLPDLVEIIPSPRDRAASASMPIRAELKLRPVT